MTIKIPSIVSRATVQHLFFEEIEPDFETNDTELAQPDSANGAD